MGLMKQKFIEEREKEAYFEEVIELHYNHLLLLGEYEEETREVIKQVKKQ